MVKKELIKSDSELVINQITQLIKENHNFLLSGGAGSGKTFTLIEVIKKVFNENLKSKIACITYTNAAAIEIRDRFHSNNLTVSTIHEFLWDNIKHFQKELKKVIISIVNDEEYPNFNIIDEENIDSTYFDSLENGIQYKEYLKLKEGIVSHDQVLLVANLMFRNYKKLCDIFKDKYDYLFVDEYQDTQPLVVELLLEHLNKSSKAICIGFFGDAMQSIYPDGVGNIDAYKGNEGIKVREVKLEQNRRNPKRIIELANKLRTDGLIQVPSKDKNAPNMGKDGKIIDGTVRFIYGNGDRIDKVRSLIGWDFNNSQETKELNLTHNLIANKAGFKELMELYDNDRILKYRDRIKKYIKTKNIDNNFEDKTFGEVIEILENDYKHDLKNISPTPQMQEYINKYQNEFNFAKEIKYSDFKKLYIDKEQLLDDKKDDHRDNNKPTSKRDNLIKHLFRIEDCITSFINNKYNELIKKANYEIKTISDKKKLFDAMQLLSSNKAKSIKEVIEVANSVGVVIIDDLLNSFIKNKEYIYKRVCEVDYQEFRNLYDYLEGKTPLSTQHKTKGSQYRNVLVVLDNGNWRNYNFESLFTKRAKETVLIRTLKIFYVCCTRTIENLVVFYNNPSSDVIKNAKELFTANEIINIDDME